MLYTRQPHFRHFERYLYR